MFRGTRDFLLGGKGSYENGQEESRQGIMPSIFGSGSGVLMGSTDSNGYDADLEDINSISVGTTIGAIAAGSTGAWIGAGTGYLVSQQPDRAKRAAVMQIRIYAQNGQTGEVMWSNRVEMEYSPASNKDNENTHRRVMYDKVVREGVKVLMDGFFVNAEGVFSESAGNKESVQKEGT
jgi:hypothetical protein